MGTQKKTLKKSLRDNICQFCNKGFSSEKTLSSHMCVKKRRYTDKDTPGARLGFRIFQRFYKMTTNSKEPKTETDFINSQYYMSFVKFARYLIDLNPIESEKFVEFVIKNGIRLSDWEKEYVYSLFLQEYIKKEPVERAAERTILEMSRWAEKNNTELCMFFKEISAVEATYLIRSGRISPWVIYLSSTAGELLDKLNSEQGKMIDGIIEPTFWNKEFTKRKDDAKFIMQVCEVAKL